MEAFHVGLGIDGDSLDTELFACPNDPQGDFAAVGDENFLEHCLTVDRIPKRLRAGCL